MQPTMETTSDEPKTTFHNQLSKLPNDEAEEHIDDAKYPGSVRLTAILVSLVLSIFLASLDVTIISTAIPAITRRFDSLEDVGWYECAMFFPVAATQSVWGKCYKYFPKKDCGFAEYTSV